VNQLLNMKLSPNLNPNVVTVLERDQSRTFFQEHQKELCRL